jgi:hypothetical protein
MAEPNPQPSEITKEELQTLPRWAIVAFAARCARRVQPLFTHSWKEAPMSYVDAVDRAISMAEAAAKGRAARGYDCDYDCDYAADAARVAEATDLDFYAARVAAAAAAFAADVDDADATRAAAAADAAALATAVAAAAATADAARATAVTAALSAAAAAARADYAMLQTLARDNQWTNESPVDVALLGPLWPEGAKPQWA